VRMTLFNLEIARDPPMKTFIWAYFVVRVKR
jgi:hypothetical protein